MRPTVLAYQIASKLYRRVRDRQLLKIRYPKVPEEWKKMEATFTDDSLIIGGFEVMQEWERPLMRVLAQEVTRNKGHVLELGFGMGISASYVMEFGCSKYTVIEPHPVVLKKARAWAKEQPVPVEVIEGFWQDTIDQQGIFDAILFDTFPLTKEDAGKNHIPFFPKAKEHLKPGGIFTYYSDAVETLSGDHLRLLMEYFSEVRLFKVSGLKPPQVGQYWHADTMVVPVCTR